jgi:capsular exopolysaccharide synthesis family protein
MLQGAGRPPREQGPADGEAVDIRALFAVLRRHAWLVAAVTVFSSAIVAYLVFDPVPRYRASGLFRLTGTGSPVASRPDEEVAKAIYNTGTNPLLSQLEVLKGREVLGEVVDREALRLQAAPGGLRVSELSGVAVAVPPGESRIIQLALEADGVEASSGGAVARARYGERVELAGVRFTVRARPAARTARLAILPRDRAIDQLGANLGTRLREKTDAVVLEYTSPDPERARRVVNTAMSVFQRANADASRQRFRRRREVVEAQLRGSDSVLAQEGPPGAGVRRDELLGDRQQLRQELQRARIAEAVEAGQVEIVHAAPLPSAPLGTGMPMKLALGVVMGLALGAVGALLKDNLGTSFRRLDEMEKLLGVPGLALVPPIAARGRPRRGGAGADGGLEGSLATVSAPRSPSAEAYRTLRTHLIFSPAVPPVKTLAVTSPSASEGKTTTAANLAVAYARQGLRVAVVDCNLRKPRLHRVFGMAGEPGLAQLLLGHVPLGEALRETAVEGLSILPAGAPSPNPSELLGGERMREMLELLSGRFDRVILDTPALLASADAAILGTLADGVLVVARAGHTDRGAAQRAVQRLSRFGANVVGAVLNDPDSKALAHDVFAYGDDDGGPPDGSSAQPG